MSTHNRPGKRAVTDWQQEFQPVPNSILRFHIPSGLYWHPDLAAYTDENGQPLETPGIDYEPDETTSGYTLNSTPVTHYPPDQGEEELVDGVHGLDIEDREESESHRHHQDSQFVTGSSKGKSSEKKSSKRDEKKPSSSSKNKKDGKSSGEKKVKGKGKEKETRYQEEAPDEPFFNPEQHQRAQQPQPQGG